MSELDEIMEGKHEIKHLRIEEDTIAFETELNNHTWNLTPRDIEIIIYCLQQENKQLKEELKEVKKILLCGFDTQATIFKALEILGEKENENK